MLYSLKGFLGLSQISYDMVNIKLLHDIRFAFLRDLQLLFLPLGRAAHETFPLSHHPEPILLTIAEIDCGLLFVILVVVSVGKVH